MEDHLKEVKESVEKDLETELRDLIPLLAAARGIVNHQSPSQIVVQHAGGQGVWISATCAAICLAAVIVLTMLHIDHSRKIDRLEDYLSAIYMQAPYLKPKE